MASRHVARWALSLRKLTVKAGAACGLDFDYTCWVRADSILARGFGMRACKFKDQIATNLFRLAWQDYEAPIPLALALLIKQSPTVFVDIGANTGFYSLLAHAAGAKEIHAFEPVREIHAMLAENVRLSDAEGSVRLSETALSNFTGEAPFFVPANPNAVETSASLDGGFRTGSVKRIVKVDTADRVLGDVLPATDSALTLFKIDVENCEHLVLEGMTRILESLRPVLVIELLEENPHAQALRAKLQGLGYEQFDFGLGSQRNPGLRARPENKNAIFFPAERRALVQTALA